MKKLLYYIGILSTLLFSATGCDSYIDITPKGAITVDSVSQYYELVINPMRCYNVSSFYMLSDDAWAKESEIFGYENRSFDGINFTFNEQAERTLLADNMIIKVNSFFICFMY